jgi:formylmethanofuran dehydrogenase subunit D
MPKIMVTLLTGRTINQGVGKELGKLSNDYMDSVSICEMDPVDLKQLDITEDGNVRVTTASGSVVLRAKESLRAPHAGIVYVPYGLWANVVISSKTDGTGMPSFKGVPAEVESVGSEEPVLRLRQLLHCTYGK